MLFLQELRHCRPLCDLRFFWELFFPHSMFRIPCWNPGELQQAVLVSWKSPCITCLLLRNQNGRIMDGVYSVCIELINDRAVQELCARNKRPDMKTRSLLLKWHNKHGIKPCMQYWCFFNGSLHVLPIEFSSKNHYIYCILFVLNSIWRIILYDQDSKRC